MTTTGHDGDAIDNIDDENDKVQTCRAASSLGQPSRSTQEQEQQGTSMTTVKEFETWGKLRVGLTPQSELFSSRKIVGICFDFGWGALPSQTPPPRPAMITKKVCGASLRGFALQFFLARSFFPLSGRLDL